MQQSKQCPFEDANLDITNLSQPIQCPFHAHASALSPSITTRVELSVQALTFQATSSSAALLKDIGGGDKIRELCTRFYARAFKDDQLKTFFFEEDGARAHGQRLADWIIQKMGGEGQPWTDSGRWGMRQRSHYKAWNCEKRDVSVRGNHFNLMDTRTWMRLHFWAARECHLHLHTAFWQWYIDFIKHFIAIYERRASRYAKQDAAWSKEKRNLDKYVDDGYYMKDLVE
ncbi:hypothetical protein THRCLA_21198 [Thraustotheca clavata]|uniref:Uncharacterized protein n=1 Tax=Thraustotheca clavata TaxID=74557 RepID=A0A1V9ZZ40_9STRA|nr:hypothetical protein THRCLA_21198 [Thraustotheca clavata]